MAAQNAGAGETDLLSRLPVWGWSEPPGLMPWAGISWARESPGSDAWVTLLQKDNI